MPIFLTRPTVRSGVGSKRRGSFPSRPVHVRRVAIPDDKMVISGRAPVVLGRNVSVERAKGTRFCTSTRTLLLLQAALSNRITYPASRADLHREHFWPGFEIACLGVETMVASTVCVHMGQYTFPMLSTGCVIELANDIASSFLPHHLRRLKYSKRSRIFCQ